MMIRPVEHGASVNVHDAKTHFSKLLARVERGEEVVIARAGQPVAKMIPIKTSRPPRVLGSAKGKVWMSDDFNAPLPEDVLKSFYGEQ